VTVNGEHVGGLFDELGDAKGRAFEHLAAEADASVSVAVWPPGATTPSIAHRFDQARSEWKIENLQGTME
jgi:hypothetical protein